MGCCTSLLYRLTGAIKDTVKRQLTLIPRLLWHELCVRYRRSPGKLAPTSRWIS
jgi:hypothetical protein